MSFFNSTSKLHQHTTILQLIPIAIIHQHNQLISEGLFAELFVFGRHNFVEKESIHLESKIKLEYKINDPDNVIEVEESKDGGKYRYSFSLKKPYIKTQYQEGASLLNPNQITVVGITSIKSWMDYRDIYYKNFEKVLNEKMPKRYSKILKRAKKGGNIYEKLDIVSSMLYSEINYLGDWRKIEGSYYPNTLIQVAKNGAGDCKDFSAIMVKILRELGIKANVALIERSNLSKQQLPNLGLPGTLPFNHAIIHVFHKNKNIWVDPTNPSSNSMLIREDISSKPSLILGKAYKELVYTPNLKSQENNVYSKQTITFLNDKEMDIKGVVHFEGRAALGFAGLANKLRKKEIDELFIKAISGTVPNTYTINTKNNFKSRISKNIDLKYHFNTQPETIRTNKGNIFVLPGDKLGASLLFDTKERVGGLYLGQPVISKSDLILKNIELLGEKSLDCSIHSKWIEAERRIAQKADGIHIKGKVNIKMTYITKKDFETTDFKLLRGKLYDCYKNKAIVYKIGKDNIIVDSNTSKSVDKLWSEVDELFKNYPLGDKPMIRAQSLLEEIIKRDPNSSMAYAKLGHALIKQGYSQGMNYSVPTIEKAQEYLKRALEIKKDNYYAIVRMAYSYIILRNFGEAEEWAYKATNLNPKKAEGFKSRAFIQLQKNKIKKAIRLYKLALELENEDISETYSKLGICYFAMKEQDLAEKYYKLAIKSNPKQPWYYTGIVHTLLNRGKFDEAITYSKKALSLMDFGEGHVKLSQAYNAKAVSYVKKNDINNAEKFYLLAYKEYNDPDYLLYLGNLYSRTKQFKKASSTYAKIIQSDPKSHKPYLLISNSLSNMNRKQDAIDILESGITTMDSDSDKAMLALGVGHICKDLKGCDKSEKFKVANKYLKDSLNDKNMTSYIRCKTNNAIAENYLWHIKGEMKQSLTYFEKAHDIDSKNPYPVYGMAQYYWNYKKDEEEAEENYLKAIKLQKNQKKKSIYYGALGKMYHEIAYKNKDLDLYEKVAKYYSLALRLNPNYVYARKQLKNINSYLKKSGRKVSSLK